MKNPLIDMTVPEVTFKTRVRDESIGGENPFTWYDLSTKELFEGKKVAFFSLPGAFTPTCSSTHAPGYDAHFEEFKTHGIDTIVCASVNDAFAELNTSVSGLAQGEVDKRLNAYGLNAIKEVDITPLDFTSKLLVNEWKLGAEEEEFTVMKVLVKGDTASVEYNLLDRYDTATKTSSMARTTGYTCTAAVNLIAKRLFTEKGVFPPELVGKDKGCFDFVMNYLKDRNVIWKKS